MLYSFTNSHRGVPILTYLNSLPVLNKSLIIQWFFKVIFRLDFSPDLVDSDFPSIQITPEVMSEMVLTWMAL